MQQAIQSIMTIEDPQVRNEALQKLKPVQDFLDGNRPFSSQSTGTIHSLFSKRLIEINQSKLVSKVVVGRFPNFRFSVWFGFVNFGFGSVWFQNRKLLSDFG